MSRSPEDVVLDKAINDLSEHFDSVRIFCTSCENGKTLDISVGCGNIFSQMGQVSNWLKAQERTPTIPYEQEGNTDRN